ncbi:MAG TPA: LysR family transcriptional regulator [Candidatus Lachnoclostridium pullistercoris]|uniref:LysR family transcriptional regulator n=1 Tax=Candidatus Lachnoclostridium pullistercoris TaxID=2838632 RepID=A0A9D2PDW4_9FIRM|nr:LysR family transcriptional regulator [Candidatus Lachnoclostridium pullistercoris]
MNFRDVEYIVKIAECGSINKASKELYVAQPSLSKCIRKVEEEYGIQLFYRSRGSSMSLTVEGKLFLEMARPVMKCYEQFQKQIQDLRDRNRFKILLGTAPQRGYDIASSLFRTLYSKYGNYFLELRTGPSLELENQLLAGDLDMIYISTDTFREELHYAEFCSTWMYIYLRKGSPASAKAIHLKGIDWPVLRLEDLEGERIVANRHGSANRKYLDEILKKNGKEFPIIEVENNSNRLAMVESGRASYFLNARQGKIWDALDSSQLFLLHPEQNLAVKNCLICRNGFQQDERFRIIRDCLHGILEQDADSAALLG